ncbi:MAG TPA: hypothetical protein VIG06_28990 [Kofleriaceae bacterium]
MITARGLAIAEMPWVGGAQALLRFAPSSKSSVVPIRPAARDFPTVEAADRLEPGDDTVAVESAAWRDGDADFYWIDAQADALGERGLVPIATAGEPLIRLELLTRCQRWLDRRNPHSVGPWFDQLLTYHRSLFDRVQAAGRAEHNRGLDVWQWVLRLDPDASAALQVAALFAPGERATDLLAGAPAPRAVGERALHLVRSVCQAALPDHDDGEVSVLEDAGCLSFFAFSSASFLDDNGPPETRRRIAATLHRLSLRACAYLPQVRLRRDVAHLFSEAAMRG